MRAKTLKRHIFSYAGRNPPSLKASAQSGREFREIKPPRPQLFADFRTEINPGMVAEKRGDTALIRYYARA
jgi:hypothetical protein